MSEILLKNIEKPTSFTIKFDENKNEIISENLQEAFLKFKKSKEVSLSIFLFFYNHQPF
jgi:hypothetical protein